MKSGRCVFRNLYLAGHRFLCVLFESVSNQLAQILMLVFDMAVCTVLYFLVQTEFDFCFFGGEVAGSANNRHYVTYQEQFRLLHIQSLGENRSFVSLLTPVKPHPTSDKSLFDILRQMIANKYVFQQGKQTKQVELESNMESNKQSVELWSHPGEHSRLFSRRNAHNP